MKTITYLYFIVLLSLCKNSAAQNYASTIKNRIHFYYVDDINNTSYTPVKLDADSIIAGRENGPFWNNPLMQYSKVLVRKILKPASSGGDRRMQEVVYNILNVNATNAKPVIFYILNDSVNTIVGSNAGSRYGACPVNSRSWPCALNFMRAFGYNPPPGFAQWGGRISMGEFFLRQNNDYSYGAFVHELAHTQDESDGRAHLYPGWTGYGADNRHFMTEAIPNMAASYTEGIANVASFLYNENNRAGYQGAFDWFANSTSKVIVETNLPTGLDPSLSLYHTIIGTGLSNDGTSSEIINGVTYNYAHFLINRLPVRALMHIENIVALIGTAYALHKGQQEFFTAVESVNNAIRQASSSGIGALIHTLCFQAIPRGVTMAELRRTSQANRSFLLPIALADYFTKFKATTKEEFYEAFERYGPLEEFIDMYWNADVTALRNHFRGATTFRRADVQTIAQMLQAN